LPSRIKKIEKKVRHWWGRFFFWVLFKVVNFIPAGSLYYIAESLGKLGYLILGKSRRTILENLNKAFGGEKTEKEVQRIAKEVVKNLSRGFFEVIRSASFSPEEWNEKIVFEGKENLDQALSRGRGVIGLSAHLGNFTLLGGRLSQEGYLSRTIIKAPSDPELGRMFEDIRSKQRHRSIPAEPTNVCVRETLKSLNKNEIVLFVADENRSPRRGGIFVDFFGHPAATATGPAVLALRTDASVVPIFIIRQPDGRHKIRIDPAINFIRSGNTKEDIISLTAKFTKIIESYVRKYPDQWMWVNKRWRSNMI
jgi:KDO2-lipid IV(A) lauroyltransferase